MDHATASASSCTARASAGSASTYGEILGTAAWPAIIKPAQTTRIRALLNDPERRTNRVARKYLLAGLLRCATCGTTMVSRPRSDGRGRYVCSRDPGRNGCGRTFILADEVDRIHRCRGPVPTSHAPPRRLDATTRCR